MNAREEVRLNVLAAIAKVYRASNRKFSDLEIKRVEVFRHRESWTVVIETARPGKMFGKGGDEFFALQKEVDYPIDLIECTKSVTDEILAAGGL